MTRLLKIQTEYFRAGAVWKKVYGIDKQPDSVSLDTLTAITPETGLRPEQNRAKYEILRTAFQNV